MKLVMWERAQHTKTPGRVRGKAVAGKKAGKAVKILCVHRFVLLGVPWKRSSSGRGGPLRCPGEVSNKQVINTKINTIYGR